MQRKLIEVLSLSVCINQIPDCFYALDFGAKNYETLD